MAEVQSKIDALQITRDKIAAGIRPDYLKRYGAIRMRRAWRWPRSATAPVSGAT